MAKTSTARWAVAGWLGRRTLSSRLGRRGIAPVRLHRSCRINVVPGACGVLVLACRSVLLAAVVILVRRRFLLLLLLALLLFLHLYLLLSLLLAIQLHLLVAAALAARLAQLAARRAGARVRGG